MKETLKVKAEMNELGKTIAEHIQVNKMNKFLDKLIKKLGGNEHI